MNNIISCEELLKREKDLSWSAFVRGFRFAIEFVNQLPPAEPKERTVKVTDQTDRIVIYKASYFGVKGKCGCGYEVIADYKYCPMCGAKLEWEQ